MTVAVFLLRGINVGGRNRLSMADLKACAAEAGATDARTYLQSGNMVACGPVSLSALSARIADRAGFDPLILQRSQTEWEALVDGNPFPKVDDHKALHLFFLAGPSAVTAADLMAKAGPEERVAVVKGAIYLHTPKHLTGSLIAERMDRLAGCPTTARNWRSVVAIRDLAREMAG